MVILATLVDRRSTIRRLDGVTELLLSNLKSRFLFCVFGISPQIETVKHSRLLTLPPTQTDYNTSVIFTIQLLLNGLFYFFWQMALWSGVDSDFDSELSLTLSAWLALFCRGSLGHQYCSGELTYFSLPPPLHPLPPPRVF